MKINLGPAGIGPTKEAIANLEEYHRLGLSACEIAFTYGVYIDKKDDAIVIGKKAKELGIKLSIHCPYWINLNSKEKSKIEMSKKRLFKCLEVGTLLGVEKIIFHAGFYGKGDRIEAYVTIKNAILDVMKEAKKNNFTPKLAPEIMGKVNVFGSIEEISNLVKDTGCSFCIDFAHVLARYKDYNFELVKKSFPEKDWHVHFSGIEYNDKGERRHLRLEKKDWKTLFDNLPKDKNFTIICESPEPVHDAVIGKSLEK